MSNVLILSAHCDDAPLCLGGSLLGGLFKIKPKVIIVFPISRYIIKNDTDLSEVEITRIRNKEERVAAELANYEVVFLGFKEVFSRYDYSDLEMVFKLLPVKEDPIYEEVKKKLLEIVIDHDGIICSPLAIGNHKDHRLILQVMKEFLKLNSNMPVLFYEDLPYSDYTKNLVKPDFLVEIDENLILKPFLFSDFDMEQKVKLIKVYQSQIDERQVKQVIHYWKSIGKGERIWLTKSAHKLLFEE